MARGERYKPGIDPAHLERVFDALGRGYGAINLPVDYQRPWRAVMGRGK